MQTTVKNPRQIIDRKALVAELDQVVETHSRDQWRAAALSGL
jgi:hypothetical protein